MLIVSFLLYSDIGIVTSMKVNHKQADFERNDERDILVGRHFDEANLNVGKICHW